MLNVIADFGKGMRERSNRQDQLIRDLLQFVSIHLIYGLG